MKLLGIINKHTALENFFILVVLVLDIIVLGCVDLFDPIFYCLIFMGIHACIFNWYFKKK